MKTDRKSTLCRALAHLIALGVMFEPAYAQDPEADLVEQSEPAAIAAEADFVWGNQYLFRGVPFTDSATMFPAVSLGAMGISASYWGAIDVSGDSDYVENDYTLGGTFSPTDLVEVSGGYIYYDLPTPDAGETSTQEVYLGVAFDVPLSPSITGFYDFDAVDGGYLSLGIGHDIDYGKLMDRENLVLSLSAALGTSFDYTTDGNGLNDLLFGAELPFQINEYTSIRGIAQYSVALSELDDIDQDDEFFFGGGLNMAF